MIKNHGGIIMNKRKTSRILAVNCNKTSGGGKIMLSLADFARNNGFEVVTATPEGKYSINIENNITITKRWQKGINWRLSKLSGNDRTLPFAQTNKLIRFIKEYKPAIVHLHGLHGYYVDYIKLLDYLKKRNIIVVWTQHDCWAYTGKCVHYTSVNCEKWQTKCYNCPQLDQFPASVFFDKTEQMFEMKKKCFSTLLNCTFVPVSKWLSEEMKKSFLKNSNIQLIANGIDTSVFYPQKSDIKARNGISEKKVILGVAASWSERKGIEDFFKLNEMIDKSTTAIIIIGINAQFINRCRDVGIVPILRTADRNELAQWYSACDVFFNPSTEETFGLVTAEAMACGAPVVGYRSTATTELLEGTSNYCVEPRDVNAAKKAIDIVLTLPKAFFSECNRTKVLENYDLISQFSKYIDLYNDLLSVKA